MNDLIKQVLAMIGGMGKGQAQFDYRSPDRQQTEGSLFQPRTAQAAMPSQAPMATPRPSASPMAQGNTPQATPIAMSQDQLAQNIGDTWGQDTPMLQNLALMMEAGNKLPGNMEKLLPLALALRETQGGQDNIDPKKNKNLGANNIYNIRGIQNGQKRFVNYPSLQVATMGGQNGPDMAQGLVGLLGENPLYEDFRKTNDYKDLFKRYSPASDGNGSLDEQQQNLEFILDRIKKGKR